MNLKATVGFPLGASRWSSFGAQDPHLSVYYLPLAYSASGRLFYPVLLDMSAQCPKEPSTPASSGPGMATSKIPMPSTGSRMAQVARTKAQAVLEVPQERRLRKRSISMVNLRELDDQLVKKGRKESTDSQASTTSMSSQNAALKTSRNISVRTAASTTESMRNLGSRTAKPPMSRTVARIPPTHLATASRARPVSRVALGSQAQNNSNVVVNTVSAGPKKSGKPKRAPWDLKGRVEDMELKIKEVTSEKGSMLEQIAQSRERINSLEEHNAHLKGSMEIKENLTQQAAGEISALEKKLRELTSEKDREIEEWKRKNVLLEEQAVQLQKKCVDLEDEVTIKKSEILGYRSSLAQLTSAQSGLRSELEITCLNLNSTQEKVRAIQGEVSEYKSHIASLEAKVESLEGKLREEEGRRRQMNNTILELKGNIRVFCRVRPLVGDEKVADGSVDVKHIRYVDEHGIELIRPTESRVDDGITGVRAKGGNVMKNEFQFDQVFGPETSQAAVFSEIAQLVQSALDGYNVCIFAYGQTGSGKTFTMEGGDTEVEMGVIPRTIKQIFSCISSLKERGWEYKVEVSFIEIYNEQIKDLIGTDKGKAVHEIKISDTKRGGDIVVTNLRVEEVASEGQILQLLRQARQQRAVAATKCNEYSSRSHFLFRLLITGNNSMTSESCRGTLNMVDLAGSERLKESGSEGSRLTETKNINRSLSNLGNVILALAQKQEHVPFRNSKLTFLLQNCLGGNSKTLMFVNVSPREEWFSESLNSLRFAARVNQCHIGTATKRIK